MVSGVPLSLIIGLMVVVTSVISGIFGMAGGLVLMLALGLILPVQAAMVLHGVTQFFSNGWRALLWRTWIAWRILGFYMLGALPALAIPFAVAYVPEKPVMLIVLGLIPFMAALLPQRLALDASRPGHAVACGFFVAGLQLVAGVAGPLLDIFFVRSTLDRRAVVATKAATQAFSHLTKVGYYGVLINGSTALGRDVYVAAVLAAVVGTSLAAPVLSRLSNDRFRSWTQAIVLTVGAVSVAQGVWLLV